MNKKKIFSAIISLLTVCAAFCSCTGGQVIAKGGFTAAVNTAPRMLSSADYSNAYEYSSGDTTLYFDRVSFAPAVRTGEKKWTALPGVNGTDAAVFYISVLFGGEIYELNSQDHSVAQGAAQAEYSKNTVTVSYDVYPDALKSFCVSLTLQYEMFASGLCVSSDTAAWTVSDGAEVLSFSLLPYFGAAGYDDPGIDLESDYFCLPDGCGAVLYTKKNDPSLSVLNYDVYTGSVIAPVFGVKQDSSAFACAVTQGDACLSVVCDLTGPYKTVYNRFDLAERSADGDIFVRAFSGEINCVYSFTDGGYLSFADVAAAARSALIRYGMLEKTYSGAHTYVCLDFADDSGDPVSDTVSAQSLLGLMKGKGIDGVRLICRDILESEGGLSVPEVREESGGKEGLAELSAFALTQGHSVYAGCFTSTCDTKRGALKNASGKKAEYENGGIRYYPSVKKQFACFEDFFASDVLAPGCGLCPEDASCPLFSSPDRGASAGELCSERRKTSSALSEKYGVLSTGGSFLSLTGADGIVCLPVACAAPTGDVYTQEPFIPAILHGFVEYACAPVNNSEIPELAILKAVEYGCSPCVEFNCLDGSANYYGTALADYSDYILGVSSHLGNTFREEITDHYTVQENVFCTEFGGSAVVYVNYNNYSAVLGDIVVPPYDYLVLS